MSKGNRIILIGIWGASFVFNSWAVLVRNNSICIVFVMIALVMMLNNITGLMNGE